MSQYLKQGWSTALGQLFIVIMLFVYRLAWGIAIYQFVKSVVVPLMHRYPGSELPGHMLRMFFIEGQFQLFKTDLANPYLWTLLLMLGLRMAFTPLLDAGIYYAVHHRGQPVGTAFFRGMKRVGKSFAILYAVQMALTVTPFLLFVYPKLKQVLFAYGSLTSLLVHGGIWLGAWLLYAGLLHLLFMHLQFGRVTGYGILNAALTFVRSSLSVVGLGALLLLITSGVILAALGGTLVWAGFAAVLIHQALYFLQALFKLWTIASQYELWKVKAAA